MDLPQIASDPGVLDLVRRALAEDLGAAGDVTSAALVPETAECGAAIVARTGCVVAGLPVAAAVFAALDARARFETFVPDGRLADPGATVARVTGRARAILAAERTALNFLQRLSGIATLTRRFVDRAGAHGVTVLDTRKTAPGLRALEKYAVLCGGGANHRFGLYDRILIKDNHRRLWRQERDGGSAPSLAEAVRRARGKFPGLKVEIEVESEEDLRDALEGEPDWVLLDNMAPDRMRRCVEIAGGRCRIEASGGITLDNVEAVARTGVNVVSLGCLTHSAPAADLSLEVEK